MLKYQYRINNSVRLSNGLTKWVNRTAVPLISVNGAGNLLVSHKINSFPSGSAPL